jgi:hypothetical protein
MIKRMDRELAAALGLLVLLTAASASAQTFGRDVTVTGPRGRTLERRTEIHRGPGGLEREIQIRRPSGTYTRRLEVHRPPAYVPRGPYLGPRFVPFGPPPPPPAFGPGALVGLGVGLAALPAIGFAAGVASRPPVVVAPAPVVVAPAPVVASPPVVVAPAPVVASPPVVVAPADAADPVNLAAQKLYSNYFGSRRDGATELGRLGDPRGVPALIHVLKYDNFKDVRIAAALALGQIGGPRAATALERCIVYEKRQAVRDAASRALALLRAREARVVESQPSDPAPATTPPPPSPRPPIRPRTSTRSQASTGRREQGWVPAPADRSPSAAEPLPPLEAPASDEAGPTAEVQPPPLPPPPPSANP